ncbi:MAG: SUF system Fe-S cluster assembly regulator [Acidobacteria bacterium]|nr:SUF system Fe-S cluster assembly regulator [Acidobacteriota bacterium]
MMRMSKLTDYGIVLLIHFVESDSKRPTYSARQLAGLTHLPLPMVSKILKLLVREGLLVSHRGANGGYRLARQPENITVGETIKAIEGSIALTECINAPGNCRVEAMCPVRHNWQRINWRINETVAKALQGITLSDMVHPIAEGFVSVSDLQPGGSPGLPC